MLALCDGTNALVRPVSPDDGPALVEFHRHLTGQPHFPRYFSSRAQLDSEEVELLTCVDGWNHVVLVVESNETLIALGRYDRAGDQRQADVAFAVADNYQQQYIASELLYRLAHAARLAGVSRLIAEVRSENATMVSVFQEAGYPLAWSPRELGSTAMTLHIASGLQLTSRS